MKLVFSMTSLIAVLIFGISIASADWLDAPHISPFAGVRWRGDVTEVKVNGQWYELVSLNDLTAQEIVAGCKNLDMDRWEKRFREDLVAVLRQMGHDPGDSVTLTLKDLQSGNVQTMEKVALTAENRQASMEESDNLVSADTTQPASTMPAVPNAWVKAPRLSPFEAVRWNENVPEVKVHGTWYGLLALDDLETSQIISKCQEMDPDQWQKRFEEDLVAVLIQMGHQPSKNVTLKVKQLDTGAEMVLDNVAMTSKNRNAIRDARQKAAGVNPAPDQDNSGGL